LINIWVARQTCLHENETFLSTHLTEKGALIRNITALREDLTDGFDEDELQDHRPDLPHSTKQDLNPLGRVCLRGIYEDWMEYSWDMNTEIQYEIYETRVEA
jgi:hypothetical protein|tara:strand:+ start:631 stop:936 length:306 start_codon:yes stop_codon:yes gene_type:complete